MSEIILDGERDFEAEHDMAFKEDSAESKEPAGVEISDELLSFVPFKDVDDEKLTEQQREEKSAALVRDKKHKEHAPRAIKIGVNALKGVEKAIQKFLKVQNTGLTDNDRREFAKGIAPVLIDFGVTDYDGLLSKWGSYLLAAYAVWEVSGKLAKGIAADHARQQAEQEKTQPEQAAPVTAATYEQDFAGRGIRLGEVVPDGN